MLKVNFFSATTSGLRSRETTVCLQFGNVFFHAHEHIRSLKMNINFETFVVLLDRSDRRPVVL